ncbi:outer membrane beta-barrel protein [Vibrio penaeicida]|uniref:Outer membrane protein beta-barrel domain-containing protein n=1 Tax=Vibrio penaeicida TaxID=104609 RepID=A0AAV5NLT3_9VIBR|nr:outer membrane beta-barrel protein [Vibrio penaeicida]RTZ22521.1 hypothetical protein EKN09_13985 [Vibrio penaeicida]GLQ71473.1 hypothetical protein GCM10007932_08330 [Vibrio penaeicida]
MKKYFVLATALISTFSMAESQKHGEREGFRLAAGFASTSYSSSVNSTYFTTNGGGGLRVDGAYDFNAMFAAKLTFEANSQDLLSANTGKIAGELSHPFNVDAGGAIKPYATLGYGLHTVKATAFTPQERESGLVYGAGIRFIASHGFYADLNVELVELKNIRLSQGAFLIGYKF